MIRRETLPQEDGSLWQYYHLADGVVVLTSKGREMIHDNPDLLGYIHQYRQRCLGSLATSSNPSIRRWFNNGGNSDVYELAEGSGLVVKESTTAQSMYFALQRMDRLKGIVESEVPRWIDMPGHYGLVCSSTSSADYMLMEKIDAGVTVSDIIDRSLEEANADERLLNTIGPIDKKITSEVSARFFSAKSLLDNAIKRHGLLPEDFLPDWDTSNVLVEKLQTPVASSNYMLWVIDQ